MSWIKMHDGLIKGFWSGVPRPYRFVMMELCLLAKPLAGVIEIPADSKDHTTGLVNLLRGNRRESRQALEYLSSAGIDFIQFATREGRDIVSIPSWNEYNPGKSSRDRMRKLRAKKKLEQEKAQA